ncbi:MAG: alanine--tRNA ligase [Candidatus Pacebacteria bacterium]|nr:alanine--tRNA ligase [Candidatus Paceibacterota bacterium]
MTLNEVREKYLAFFQAQGHTVLPSSSLVPENDPTTLFTGSGMQPLVPYLLGKNHPAGTRLVDSQKCFRSMDIEEVGDNRHTTFFEMLGNWSLGDYFKQEQLPWFFEFLVGQVGLDPNKLYVTTFIGDENNNVPRDTESAEIWKRLFDEQGIDNKVVDIGSEENGYQVGMQGGRIFYYDAKKNWWSRAGVPEKMPAGEPGGPDSEVFYDFGTPHDPKWGPECHPNCDCGRFLEIGNSVFMQYIKKEDGSFALLPKQNVDFGGGLERIAAVLRNESDVFNIDVFDKAKEVIFSLCGTPYYDEGNPNGFVVAKSGGMFPSEMRYMYRVILDHIRAATFLIGDSVLPNNKDQGYFVRRLIRRAVRFGHKLGIDSNFTAQVAKTFIDTYENSYPELKKRAETIQNELTKEEEKFRETLARGIKELERFTGDAVFDKNGLTAQYIFQLVTTYGFPLELILEEAGEKGIKQIDIEGFKDLLKQHQDLSRAGSEQKFKGGLADTSEKTTRLHTAHHLLLKALQQVLGPEVHQRGSNITQERLRIDFSWGAKMTDGQKKEVEKIVNEKINEDLPVVRTEMAKEEAEKLGAEHEFGAKYPDKVSVYSVGPLDSAFSIEFCGGPHVEHTGEISKSGMFKIQKEEAVAQGVRRIKAVLQ